MRISFTIVFILFSILLASTHADVIKSKTYEYGKSSNNNKLIANIHYQKNVRPKKIIIITEGIHGNEYLGLTSKLSTAIKDQMVGESFSNFFQNGGVFIIIPKVNPDGVLTRTRASFKGEDLNRAFTVQSHPSALNDHSESALLIKFIDKFLEGSKAKLVFAVDYHCCGGAGLIPSDSNVSNQFYSFLDVSMKSLLNKSYAIRKTKDIFGQQFKGTLKDYWFEKYQSPALTFEAKTLNESSKSKNHIAWWNNVLAYLNTEDMTPDLGLKTRSQLLSMAAKKASGILNYSE
jgi:succinylglutamate desuccinylase